MEAAARNVVCLTMLGLTLVGCPVKKEKIVEKIVQQTANAPAAAAKPTASVHGMVMVARVKLGTAEKAVVAAAGYAELAGIGDKIGTEGAEVLAIAANGVQVRMPDTTSILIRMSKEVPLAGGAAQPGTPSEGREQALSDAELKAFVELEKWRISVISYVTSGYGVPADVLLALSTASMAHTPANVGEALRKLGWNPAAMINKVTYNRITIRRGTIAVSGDAPNKAAFDALLGRLKNASPLVTGAKTISLDPAGGGFAFELVLEAPLLQAADIALEGSKSGGKPLPAEMRERLGKAASKLPTSSAVAGFGADLKNLATQSGLTVKSITRQPKSLEEGFLGMVSFKMEASGSTQALIALLSGLRKKGATEGPPVVIDPLIVQGNGIVATVRVPYVAGKADARSPAPNSVFLPNLNSARWKPVRAIPMSALRDPMMR